MTDSKQDQSKDKTPKTGQGFNDARGEIDDKDNVPAHNGLNVDNDPQHKRPTQKQQQK